MLEQQWKEFCLACFGNISEQQYIDLRRTFYGGASALFIIIMNFLDPSTDEPAEADMQKMTSLKDEIFKFNQEVKAGRA